MSWGLGGRRARQTGPPAPGPPAGYPPMPTPHQGLQGPVCPQGQSSTGQAESVGGAQGWGGGATAAPPRARPSPPEAPGPSLIPSCLRWAPRRAGPWLCRPGSGLWGGPCLPNREQAPSRVQVGKVSQHLGPLSANVSWVLSPGPPGSRQVSGPQALSGPARGQRLLLLSQFWGISSLRGG